MTVIDRLREWLCDHRFHSTGLTRASGGFQVQCRRCGRIETWCDHCPADCEVCT